MKLGAKFEIFNNNSFVIICYNHILCWLNANCCCPLIDIISKYEDEKEKLFMSILGKKEKSIMSEQEKACNDKITQLEGSLKKKVY
jgi:hypothetical protein